ncbi:MAG: hypothetical protein KDN20_21610 [Verrucomicrobiae bacterium]|nr:hypothetical protein [Verrucomicrobiae bacterium]
MRSTRNHHDGTRSKLRGFLKTLYRLGSLDFYRDLVRPELRYASLGPDEVNFMSLLETILQSPAKETSGIKITEAGLQAFTQ